MRVQLKGYIPFAMDNVPVGAARFKVMRTGACWSRAWSCAAAKPPAMS
ncbi:MAG: hypothetical protein Q8Q85_06425 [Gemmatimonadales bacterium]|nr:hypothetical protein [Gemmatimonadales bacterium]